MQKLKKLIVHKIVFVSEEYTKTFYEGSFYSILRIVFHFNYYEDTRIFFNAWRKNHNFYYVHNLFIYEKHQVPVKITPPQAFRKIKIPIINYLTVISKLGIFVFSFIMFDY